MTKIEALSGVQALSAAPAIAKLRHLYQNMVNGAVRDTASAKRIAEGLLAPAIEALGRATPPAEQQAAQVIIDFSQVGTAGPFPVANGRVSLPDATMQDLARMLRPTYEAEQQAAPKTAPGVGNSGFDHQTAADFLNGKTVSDEAVRKFVATSRWAHDERAALSATLLAMRGVLTSREAEIALLKKALLEAETAPQPSPAAQGDAIEHELAMLIRRIVSSARRNCEDGSNVLKLANEAWAYLVRKGLNGSPLRDAGIESDPTPPAKAADSVQEDAARYRWLRATTNYVTSNGERIDVRNMPEKWDAAIDAALAAQGGKA